MGESFGGGTTSYSSPSLDTAVFDHLAASGGWTARPWRAGYVGSPEMPGAGGVHQPGGRFTVTGQGDIAPIPSGHGGPADPAVTVSDYLVGTFAGLIALVVIAALFVTAEYRRGLIRLTFAATPARGRVLAAKSAVVAAVGFVVGLAGAAGALILPGRGLSAANGYLALSLGNDADLRAACGSVLYLTLIALLAFGVTAAVRDAAAGLGLVLGLLLLFPIMSAVIPDHVLARHLEQVAPMTAGLYVQATTGLDTLPLTPWQGLGVTALCALGALVLGAAALRLRDA